MTSVSYQPVDPVSTLPVASSVRPSLRVEIQPGKGFAINPFDLPEMKPFEVEIEPLYSFISAGTELNTFQKFLKLSEGSTRNSPTGYSQCGRVKAVGSAVKTIRPGQLVTAIGQGAFHSTRTFVAQNLVTPVPEGVDPQGAALAAMFCFAMESVQKSKVRLGENAIVFGAGMMGQLAARLYALSGARCGVVDSNAFRLNLLPDGIPSFALCDEGWQQLADWAGPYGIEHVSICFGGDATEVVNRVKRLMPRAPDGVPHGRIVFPGGAFLSVLMASNMGNIELISSAKAGPGYRDPVYESGIDYPAAYVSHPVQRNVRAMLRLMQEKKLDLRPLVTHTFPFEKAMEAYEMLLSPEVRALAVLIDYTGL